MILISVIFFALYFSIFAALLVLLVRANWQKTVAIPAEKVNVSILIAARNEAANIERCLRAIEKLNYPAELIEILIGNDASIDNTQQIVFEFIAGKPNYKLISIESNLGLARGKANVLAHLARQATSGYFFITDADVEVPPTWIETMLAEINGKTAIVTGITTVSGSNIFSRMQALDWLNALGLIQVVSDLKVPVTTLGNNMLLTREAYQRTVGYEQIPFSITEDVKLFQEVLKCGYSFKNLYNPQVLALTRPIGKLADLLHQRKRWMQGTAYLPLLMQVILVLYASFYAVALPFFWHAPFPAAFGILLLKWLLQSIFITICLRRLKLKVNLKDLFLFEFYQLFISVTLIIFYFLPLKVNWKGRKY